MFVKPRRKKVIGKRRASENNTSAADIAKLIKGAIFLGNNMIKPNEISAAGTNGRFDGPHHNIGT